MKRIVILVFACALAPLAGAQLFKYVDKDGKTVYSDQPPVNVDSKQVNIQSAPAAASPAAPKSALERDKELEKARAKSREEAKKSDIASRNAQAVEERCTQATNYHRTFVDGGRISKYNEKGEKVLMDDQEIDAEREKARRQMEEACKKG
jgi:FtsZ-interacting cell division protein YlmF